MKNNIYIKKMENDKQSRALTENGIEIIRKIDNKSLVNITVQIQSIINDNPKYKKVIVCDNEASIQLLFPPKFFLICFILSHGNNLVNNSFIQIDAKKPAKFWKITLQKMQ